MWLSGLVEYFKRLYSKMSVMALTANKNIPYPQLPVLLHSSVIKISSNQSLDIKNSILRVNSCLVLGSISNKALSSLNLPSNIRGGDTISLLVRNNLIKRKSRDCTNHGRETTKRRALPQLLHFGRYQHRSKWYPKR
jgi:hypothetical protein